MYFWRELLISSKGYSYHLWNPELELYYVYIKGFSFSEIDYKSGVNSKRTLNNGLICKSKSKVLPKPTITTFESSDQIKIKRAGSKLKTFTLLHRNEVRNPAHVFKELRKH